VDIKGSRWDGKGRDGGRGGERLREESISNQIMEMFQRPIG
jgi:hypothetical protein